MTGRADRGFYLYCATSATAELDGGNVFYWATSERTAQILCRLLSKEYSSETGGPFFLQKRSDEVEQAEQILLAEAMDWLSVYSADPDPGVYDPEPPESMMVRAEYAGRARDWEPRIVESAVEDVTHTSHPEATDLSPDKFQMPVDDRRNSGLTLLLLLAQAYYKILECVVPTASWCCALDLELNESYLWTITSIEKLVANHQDLRDFPGKFEPIFPDLYPTTIRDVEWEDMIAPDVEQFLSSVQRYVRSKGMYPVEKPSSGWIFIELYRPMLETAVERAVAYNERMRKLSGAYFGDVPFVTDSTKGCQQTTSVLSVDSHHRRDPSSPAGRERSEVKRAPLNYRSEIKRAILVQLTKQPRATDAEICRGLDADGAVEVPATWKNKPGDRRFFDAYCDPRTRHKAEVLINKVRRDMRKQRLPV